MEPNTTKSSHVNDQERADSKIDVNHPKSSDYILTLTDRLLVPHTAYFSHYAASELYDNSPPVTTQKKFGTQSLQEYT